MLQHTRRCVMNRLMSASFAMISRQSAPGSAAPPWKHSYVCRIYKLYITNKHNQKNLVLGGTHIFHVCQATAAITWLVLSISINFLSLAGQGPPSDTAGYVLGPHKCAYQMVSKFVKGISTLATIKFMSTIRASLVVTLALYTIV